MRSSWRSIAGWAISKYWGSCMKKYMHLVYGVCLKYLEEREWAKDEVMNIFTKLVTAAPQQKIDNFKTWLYVVTKNHCLMLLRSRKSDAVHMEAMTADPTFFMENSVEMHPLEEEESDMERLRECIERLKEEQQGCIRLFFYEGCSYRQISERRGDRRERCQIVHTEWEEESQDMYRKSESLRV